MSTRWLLLTLLCVVLIAAGQMLFKVAAAQWRIDGWSWCAMARAVCWIGTASLGLGTVTASRGVRLRKDRGCPCTGVPGVHRAQASSVDLPGHGHPMRACT